MSQSSALLGTQMRPSLRSDSLMSVVLDCQWELTGSAVGWNCTMQAEAKAAPRRWARQVAVALEAMARVE